MKTESSGRDQNAASLRQRMSRLAYHHEKLGKTHNRDSFSELQKLPALLMP